MGKKIMLAGALLLTVLHNIVPHAHHGELAVHQHERLHGQADDLLDYLGLAFQQDIDFSPVQATPDRYTEKSVTTLPALLPAGSPRSDHFPIITSPYSFPARIAAPKRQTWTAHGLRAPPPVV